MVHIYLTKAMTKYRSTAVNFLTSKTRSQSVLNNEIETDSCGLWDILNKENTLNFIENERQDYSRQELNVPIKEADEPVTV